MANCSGPPRFVSAKLTIEKPKTERRVHQFVDNAATSVNYCPMKKKALKAVGVKKLKNNLSSYLREVRGGSTVLITDRNNIVAELHEPFTCTNVAGAMDPLLQS